MLENNLLPLPYDVNKANELIRNKVTISNKIAGRMFASFVSLIKPEDTKFHEYEIPVIEITKGLHGGDNYKQVKEALHNLVGKCNFERKLEGKSYQIIPVFSIIEYDDKNKKVRCGFNEKMMPYLLDLKANYTKYNLMEFLKLPSIYSQKLFELLKSWEKLGEVVLQIDELYRILDAPKTYTYTDFKRFVLIKAYKDIHEKTTLKYEYEPLKKGRSFTHIKFTFGQKSLEVKKEKTKEQSQDKNKLFIAAFNCAKSKAGLCQNMDNRKKICEVCQQSKFCNGLLNQARLV